MHFIERIIVLISLSLKAEKRKKNSNPLRVEENFRGPHSRNRKQYSLTYDEEKLLKKNSPIYRSFLISFEINIVIRETLLYGNENCNFSFLYICTINRTILFFVEMVKK